jgi:periplasmic divalent cation tolerance protein
MRAAECTARSRQINFDPPQTSYHGRMTDALIVLCTMPPGEPAEQMARTLVAERLAACVNLITGVRSLYSWQGQLCDDAEVLALIKTTRAGFETLRARLAALHPYDCPEIVALPVQAGHEPYLAWLAGAVGPA